MGYAKIIESSKFDAIEKANLKIAGSLPNWNDDKNLLNQLLNL